MDYTLPSPATLGFDSDLLSEEDPRVLPLMFARRGQLIDNLDVFDAGDRALPVLSHEYHVAFASLLLKTLALKEHGSQPSPELSDTIEELAAVPSLDVEEASLVVSRLFSPEPRELGKEQTIALRKEGDLEALARRLVREYVILTELPSSMRLVKYSYDSPFESVSQHGVEPRARKWLGHTPFSFLFATGLVRRCESYHLRMTAPPGRFVAEQMWLTPAEPSDQANGANLALEPHQFDARVLERKGRIGSSYAHMYIDSSDPDAIPDQLFARLTFLERHPGSLMASLLITLIVALTLGVFFCFVPDLLEVRKAVQSDVATLLLTIPGFVAVWLSRALATTSFLAAPLSARFGVLVSAFASYLGAIWLTFARVHGSGPVWTWIVLGLCIVVLVGLAARLWVLMLRNLKAAVSGVRRDLAGKPI